MTNILIAENIPSLNKGEMAIFGGMLESFKLLDEVKVTMFSHTAVIESQRYKDKAKIIDISKSLFIPRDIKNQYAKFILSLWGVLQHFSFLLLYKILGRTTLVLFRQPIWRAYVEADVVIVGHDGAFGIGSGLATPLYCMPLYIPVMVKFMGKPAVIYGGSIGRPIRFKTIQNFMMRYVMNKLDLITLREHRSYDNLTGIGVITERVHVLTDPAFLCKPLKLSKAEEILAEQKINLNGGPLIGFTFTRKIASCACPELYDVNEKYKYHTQMMAAIIDDLIDRLGASVVFLPHCIGQSEKLDDRLVGQDIFNKCKNKERVKVITDEYSAEELKALIGKCDLFIGERIHSVIGAISMGVPSIAISYTIDQRLNIISGVFGEEELICKVEEFNTDSLLAKIMDLWERRMEIGQRLQHKIEPLKKGAMTNGELLRKVLAKYNIL